MELALSVEGDYGAGMVKELVLPNDLAACHAIIREQAQQLEDQKARTAKAKDRTVNGTFARDGRVTAVR
jgi:hypothetical protein